MSRRTEHSLYHRAEEDLRRRVVTDALVYCGGSRSQMSEILGVTRKTASTWAREFKLDRETLTAYKATQDAADRLGVPVPPDRAWKWLTPELDAPWNPKPAGQYKVRGVWWVALEKLQREITHDAYRYGQGVTARAAGVLGVFWTTMDKWRKAFGKGNVKSTMYQTAPAGAPWLPGAPAKKEGAAQK